MKGAYTEKEIKIMRDRYPQIGLRDTAILLGRPVRSVASKASQLKLRIDRNGRHFQTFQARAAKSKIGKKRPAQSLVMKRNHAEGKLKKNAAQRLAISVRVKKWIAKNGHPRGSLGMKHTEETKRLIGLLSARRHEERTPEEVREIMMKAAKTRVARGVKLNPRGSWKQEWRTIGGREVFCRSSWEANYGRYLEWMKQHGFIREWEHEPETFWFDKVRRGCVSYLPDFRVTMTDGAIEYHEVKGYMDDRSKTKTKRMAKYYPQVKLIMIDAKFYRSLAKMMARVVPEWE